MEYKLPSIAEIFGQNFINEHFGANQQGQNNCELSQNDQLIRQESADSNNVSDCSHEYCASFTANPQCAIEAMEFSIHPKCKFTGGKVPDGCSKYAGYGYFKSDGTFINLYCHSHRLSDMFHGSGNKSPKVEKRKGGILYLCNYTDCDRTVAYRAEGNIYCSYHARKMFGNPGTRTKALIPNTRCVEPGCKAGALYGKHLNAIYYCVKHNHGNYYKHKRYMCAISGCENDIQYYDHVLKSNYCPDHINRNGTYNKITNATSFRK